MVVTLVETMNPDLSAPRKPRAMPPLVSGWTLRTMIDGRERFIVHTTFPTVDAARDWAIANIDGSIIFAERPF